VNKIGFAIKPMRMGLPISPLPLLRLAPKVAPKKTAPKRLAKSKPQPGRE